MATYLDSPQSTFASGSSLPTSLRFSASRLAFCLAIGLAVVAATGIMLARMDVPINAVNSSGGRILTSAIRPATAISLTATPNPQHASSRRSHAVPNAHAESADLKMPDAVKPAIFRLNGKEFLVVKMISIPVAEPAQPRMTSASVSAPTAANPAQPGLDGVAKPAPLNVASL